MLNRDTRGVFFFFWSEWMLSSPSLDLNRPIYPTELLKLDLPKDDS